ncbi:MAG: universal stress protein [Bryobacteraceae bacterium]|nr:universal stress protein [Bryobacteraceae bacterium]
MPPLHRIVAAADFTDLSAGALRYADAIARQAHAQLTVVYAQSFTPPAYFTRSQVTHLVDWMRSQSLEVETRLREFTDRHIGSGERDYLVIEGTPAEVILDSAKQLNAGLIVQGTHARSGVERWFLGSVAEHVLAAAEIPVLTVRGGGETMAIRNILCPVTGDAPQLSHAIQIARYFQAAVEVLRVEEPGHALAGDPCAALSAEERAGCAIRQVVRKGDAAKQILSHASESGCDLLVIGARRHRMTDTSMLGTTTYQVVRLAPCPVLMVPLPV